MGGGLNHESLTVPPINKKLEVKLPIEHAVPINMFTEATSALWSIGQFDFQLFYCETTTLKLNYINVGQSHDSHLTIM